MTYEEKLERLSDNDFFALFSLLRVEPRWVHSAGKSSIQIIGRCHNGNNHSAVFDPSTLKVTCFSECGGGMLFHTFVKRVLNLDSPQEAKDFVEDWADGQKIDFESRISKNLDSFVYEERPFVLEDVPPIQGIDQSIIKCLYSGFDTSEETLSKLVWCTKDCIDVQQLMELDVAYYPKKKTIILPHHNINGEIVGLYERSFLPLRKQMKEEFPDADYKWLCQFPRAKYVPLLKDERFIQEDEMKTSWSFSNIQNLYGLHLAKDAIKETGKAIIFEGAKSVMLARQYGYPYAVASHTFGANVKQICMLINCGAKEIVLAFDKQYETIDKNDRQWLLYDKKTRGLANKIKEYVNVSRITDFDLNNQKPLLEYKDSPIDRGKKKFEKLFGQREKLIVDKKEYFDERYEFKSQVDLALEGIRKKKAQVHRIDAVELDKNGLEPIIYL